MAPSGSRRIAPFLRIVVGVTLTALIAVPTAPPAQASDGTDVCSSVSGTWTAADSPYRLCAQGATVAGGQTLTIDSGVSVVAEGAGGLTIYGTLNADANAAPSISFSSAASSPGAWSGLDFTYTAGSSYGPGASLDNVTIADAVTGIAINDASFSGSDLTITDSSLDGFDECASSGSLSASHIERSGRNGISANNFQSPCRGSFGFTGNTIDSSAEYGADVIGGALQNNAFTNNGNGPTRYPAAAYEAVVATTDFAGNTGAGNGIDAVVLSTTVYSLQGDLIWISPTNSTTLHPLGYLGSVNITGTLTYPAGAVVEGGGYAATIDASAGGAVFTGYDDGTVATPACPSVLSSSCSITPHGFALRSQSATISNAQFRGFPGLTFFQTATVEGTSDVGGTSLLSAGDPSDTPQAAKAVLTNDSVSNVAGPAVAGIFASLTITHTSFADVSGAAVLAEDSNMASPGLLDVEQTSFARCGSGIVVASFSDPIVKSNTFDDLAGTAIGVDAPHLSVGPGQAIDSNQAAGGGDVLLLGGTLTQNLAWQSPTGDAQMHPLGYEIGASSLPYVFSGGQNAVRADSLIDQGPYTVTVGANATVAAMPGTGLSINGGTLDASAGGAIFQTVGDPGGGAAPCGASGCWTGIALGTDSNNDPTTADVSHATIRGGAVSLATNEHSSAFSPSAGVVVTGDSFDGASLTVVGNGSAEVDSTAVVANGAAPGRSGIAITAADASVSGVNVNGGWNIGISANTTNLTIDTAGVSGALLMGISALATSSFTLSRSRVTNNGFGGSVGAASTGGIGLATPGQSTVTMTCDVITGNNGGITAQNSYGGPGTSIYPPAALESSDIHGNSDASFAKYDAVTYLSLNDDWWGHAGGPSAGQLSPGESTDPHPLSAPSSCAGADGSDAPRITVPHPFDAGKTMANTVTKVVTIPVTADGPGNVVMQPASPTEPLLMRRDGCAGKVLARGAGCSIDFAVAGSNPTNTLWLQDNAIGSPQPIVIDTQVIPWNNGEIMDAYGGLHYWGAGTPVSFPALWPGHAVARAAAGFGSGGYILDGHGGIHAYGGMSAVSVPPLWPTWDIARGLVLNPCDTTDTSGYILDGYGGIHAYGGAPQVHGTAFWPGQDLAKAIVVNPCASDGTVSGYVLDAYGKLHSFSSGVAIPNPTLSAQWPGWNIARAAIVTARGQGYVLDGWGGVHPFGGLAATTVSAFWQGRDIARALISDGTGAGGWVVDGYGGMHPFGGDPSVPTTFYSAGNDIIRGGTSADG